MSIELEFIARVRSPYLEKFGIPRQPGLAPGLHSRIELLGPYAQADCLQGLNQCSHIWLQFIFHHSQDTPWRPKVRPPRLGGNRSMGVFATRSPVRPNPIGLSAAKIERIDFENAAIEVSGLDLLDGTPIVDIKPYVPYVDAKGDAVNQFAEEAPLTLEVVFDEVVEAFCVDWDAEQQAANKLSEMIRQILAQDPRPAYQKGKSGSREYGMSLKPVLSGSALNIRWVYETTDAGTEVLRVITVSSLNK
ncbi:tRNA (N6-threonylcarbamoyladenosine(37)-N6)-methyltransferase TrmO [Pseudoteredinibacter isoporae]|uniref:tRNA-Thr(GGU) m(6)t(6)A37 methyltransferase TsaA n=1 Tax=Pseudoteredinibacter isoporae TaxID=570281 RepID=A0A7X0JXK6_9GAMM|nr:tRNA-Thr(GGU) m(6)t(6)A37 methyltransferase TsaA [Pseudoteredinibacter isoporae]NHO89082.1 tRNA (N6-threonylcarbamoyladenosine(37)-N6)-methyltransferase TrmO [Pseudoteredinibacter isoporae]NIB22307.1 tRNA (N6-threonylcarbamoyladenosine(37)-N6)-methyltransferase TrmO [Pseudoteredinibacter isoporae]